MYSEFQANLLIAYLPHPASESSRAGHNRESHFKLMIPTATSESTRIHQIMLLRGTKDELAYLLSSLLLPVIVVQR